MASYNSLCNYRYSLSIIHVFELNYEISQSSKVVEKTHKDRLIFVKCNE